MIQQHALREQLIITARHAATQSYSPYSRFAVGAAVLTASGDVVPGCNIENSSYGLTMCAERTAIFTAIAQGHRAIQAVVIYTPTATATAPCGACRQVIYEFGANALVISVCDSDEYIETTAAALLPFAFGMHNLVM